MPMFRISVERIDAPVDGPVDAQPDRLTFEAKNHDDILLIARRTQNRPGLEPDEAAALLIGMKLFGEVMLKRRKEPPFAELFPHFREFMGAFKAANQAANAPTGDEAPAAAQE